MTEVIPSQIANTQCQQARGRRRQDLSREVNGGQQGVCGLLDVSLEPVHNCADRSASTASGTASEIMSSRAPAFPTITNVFHTDCRSSSACNFERWLLLKRRTLCSSPQSFPTIAPNSIHPYSTSGRSGCAPIRTTDWVYCAATSKADSRADVKRSSSE